jgi:hypothetical protein
LAQNEKKRQYKGIMKERERISSDR